LARKMVEYRQKMAEAVSAKNDRMQEQGWANYTA